MRQVTFWLNALKSIEIKSFILLITLVENAGCVSPQGKVTIFAFATSYMPTKSSQSLRSDTNKVDI